jgi:uroporphyrinogen III methyltransferase/synthase
MTGAAHSDQERGAPPGRVYLVGAGPGDPGLLTVRARELLVACDAIVYDRLAVPALPMALDERTELHFVGKRPGGQSMKQEEINALLVSLGREGKTVCRFKGGDPLVFGRGAEEAEALLAAGIPFEIVPGVTAGIAAAAYAGIPVTQRGVATRVTLVTGHEDPAKESSQVDWRYLGADPHQTIVAYMPVANLPVIAAELIAGGLSPDTPSALIERGTLPSQRVLTTPLADLAAAATQANIQPPTLLIVGPTVALHERLSWLVEPPLSGKRVVVTRPAGQAAEFSIAIRRLGIEPLFCPLIETVPAADADAAPLVTGLNRYDWIFFTSTNGVRYFFTLLRRLGLDLRCLGSAKLAAVGAGTADELARHRLNVDFVPASFRGEALLQEFLAQQSANGARILRVRGDLAASLLEEGLRQAGASVDAVTVYRTRRKDVRPDILEALATEGVDAITFTSGSAVDSFETLEVAGHLHGRIPAVCIGPVTAARARDAGWQAVHTAAAGTIESLVTELRKVLAPAS